jgi:cystathionine beta-lyase/cystathionine gamma-synthase
MSWSSDTTSIHPSRRKGTQPVSTPIFQTATFQLSNTKEGATNAQTIAPDQFYTRWGNPTTRELENAIARLEGAQAGLCTASGMGAISAAVIATLGGSGHIVAQRSLYASTHELFDHLLKPFGCTVTYFEPSRMETLAPSFRPDTKLVFIETPANPTLELTDIEAVSKEARQRGVQVLCDNTFASPLNQNPIALGATAAIHSMTKYIGGHSDATGGAVVGPKEWIEKVWFVYKILGPSLSPHDAWLFLRGLKTLPIRVRKHNENAQKLAEFLEAHPKVAAVHYPGLRSFPQRALASKQMRGSGGMLSFELKRGFRAAKRFCESLNLATLAVSLGGVETLVQHPGSMTHGPLSDEERKRSGIGAGLVRVSVGIEDPEDILEDFGSALRKA